MSAEPNLAEPFQPLYDLLIVGMGPAGVACALQARRDGLLVMAVSDEAVGGLLGAARRIDNLPLAVSLSGESLSRRMNQDLATQNIRVVRERVTAISRQKHFCATLSDQRKVLTKTVCLATGTTPRGWDLCPSALAVARDARSLPDSLTGKQVAIIGGGEAALDTALTARERGGEVQVLVRGFASCPAPSLLAETQRLGIRIHLLTEVLRVRKDSTRWILSCSQDRDIWADELAVCIGRTPRLELMAGLSIDETAAKADPHPAPGVFLAGDLLREQDRYVALAMADGQRAALLAARHLRSIP